MIETRYLIEVDPQIRENSNEKLQKKIKLAKTKITFNTSHFLVISEILI